MTSDPKRSSSVGIPASSTGSLTEIGILTAYNAAFETDAKAEQIWNIEEANDEDLSAEMADCLLSHWINREKVWNRREAFIAAKAKILAIRMGASGATIGATPVADSETGQLVEALAL